jgi:hypothetical protein
VKKTVPAAGGHRGIFETDSLWACAFFALFTAFFLWPFLTHHGWIPGTGDMICVWPYKYVWIESLKRGYPALWNPYSSLGIPFVASCSPGPYAPFNFLFFLMTTTYAFTWVYFLHFVISAFGTYLFLRSLGTGWLGAALGGLAFAFSGYFMGKFCMGGLNVITGAAWLPLMLYGLQRFVDLRRFSSLLISAAAFGLATLDGTPQIDLYALMITGFYLLWAWWTGRMTWKTFLAAEAVFVALGFSLGLCQIAPTAQFAGLSNRWSWTLSDLLRDSFVPGNLRFLIDPFFNGTPDQYHGTGGYAEVIFYIGLAPIFLALAGLGTLWRRPWVIWFGLVAFFTLAYAMADTTTPTHYVYEFLSKTVPGLSHNRVPSRILVLTTFALACLAGLALDAWVVFWRNKAGLSGPSRALLTAGLPALVLLATAADLYRFDIKHDMSSGAGPFFTDLFPPNLLNRIKQDPSHPRVQPASAYCEYQLLQNISSVVTGCGSFFIGTAQKYMDEQYYHPDSPLSDLINLKYNHRDPNAQPTERWKEITEPGTSIWLNSQPYPRAFMVGGYEVNPDYSWAIDAIRDGKVDARQEVVLTREPGERPSGPKGWVGEASITRYDYNDVEIECSNDQPCFLFLSDNYYPGWRAWVDGAEKPIYLADGTFRAIPLLSPGRHQVRMSYYPAIIVGSFFYTLMAWALVLAAVFFQKRLDQWAFRFWGRPKNYSELG